MCTGGELAVIGTVLYSTYESSQQQEKAQEAQQQQAEATQRQYQEEKKRADIQNLRSVREQIRAARVAQSSMVNQAALTGGTGGSGVAGGVASTGSQLSGNVNYMQQIAAANTAIAGEAATAAYYGSQAAQAQSEAAIWGTIGQAAGTTGMQVATKYS